MGSQLPSNAGVPLELTIASELGAIRLFVVFLNADKLTIRTGSALFL